MSFNIPRVPAKRVVIVGGGFGGLKLCSTLAHNPAFQVVLIDKNNFHQFPPLIYQVATAGLQVNSITFPFRKMFAGLHTPVEKWTLFGKKTDANNVYFRMCELRAVYPKERYIQTSIGKLDYDYLVIATGTTTNYFGNKKIQDESMPMKTIDEAMGLRNALLETFERANTCATQEERAELLNVVIVGGGPTGVEIAGALAEMREHVLPKDYPSLDHKLMNIHLVQGGDRLLPAMSKTASAAALKYLQQMGVSVELNAIVTDYDDHQVKLSDGRVFKSQTIIWVCGVTGRRIKGMPDASYGPGNRLVVDNFNQVKDCGVDNIFAIGDIALMRTHAYPKGHPQMAQAAIQQGKNLAQNFMRKEQGQPLKRFEYRNLGSMATIGRNKAVADIAGMNFTGIFAWFMWMGVHLMSILGVKNKATTLLDWAWSYLTYDRSARIIVSGKVPRVIMQRNYEVSQRHWGESDEEQVAEAKRIVQAQHYDEKAKTVAEQAKVALASSALSKADLALARAMAAAAPAEPKAEPKSEPKAEAKPEPKAEPKAEAKPEPKSEPKAEPKSEPKAEAKPEPKSEPKAEPKAEAKPEPKAEAKSEPVNVKSDEAAAVKESKPKAAPRKRSSTSSRSKKSTSAS